MMAGTICEEIGTYLEASTPTVIFLHSGSSMK